MTAADEQRLLEHAAYMRARGHVDLAALIEKAIDRLAMVRAMTASKGGAAGLRESKETGQ